MHPGGRVYQADLGGGYYGESRLSFVRHCKSDRAFCRKSLSIGTNAISVKEVMSTLRTRAGQ